MNGEVVNKRPEVTSMKVSPQAKRPNIKELPGPRAREIIERDARVMSTSYVRPYPFVPADGSGVWLRDIDGNEFLDFMAGIAVSTTGYNHPHVVRAIHEQATRFMHACLTDFPQEIATRLAERLNVLSGGGYRAFFGNSGAEAVEAAIKLARRHTKRSHIISTLGSFHGRTYGAITLTGSKTNYRAGFGPMLPGVIHVPYPDPYRPVFGATRDTVGEAVLRYIEDALYHTVLPPEEVAAIILEPLQGEGGYIEPAPGFLEGVRKLCDRYGILLIFDEVQSGMGRTGKFHAHTHWNVRPDMITLAKGIASGLPISALLAREEIMTWPEGSHGSTFGGNPVAAAAAHATLDLLVGSVDANGCPDCPCTPNQPCTHGLIANAAQVGELLLEQFRALAKDHPQLGHVRGKGLFIGLEFIDPQTGAPNPDYRDRVSYKAFELGLLNLPCGTSSLRLSPPLIINETEALVGFELLAEAIKTTML